MGLNSLIRDEVKGMYKLSEKWHKRVDNMSDAQVYAIYQRNERLKEERAKADEEYAEFLDALQDEDSSKLDEIFKQEALF